MSTNQIKIHHLGTEVSTQCTHDTCLMTHLSLEVDFTTSELRAINWCHMYMGIFFISDITNHQGNHLQQSATDNVTSFNVIHDFNCPRKHHTTIEEWRTRNKSMRDLCDEIKEKLRTTLVKWSLDGNTFITSWQYFLSRYLYTLY